LGEEGGERSPRVMKWVSEGVGVGKRGALRHRVACVHPVGMAPQSSKADGGRGMGVPGA
jgi:hypothetical protein